MNHFGEWSLHADGRVHYRLRGAALCGSPAADTGKPGPRRTPNGKLSLRHDCRECKLRNNTRWSLLKTG